MRSSELAKSIDVRTPNFQKDVIIPQIYDLDNIKLIQSCYQEETPRNNVVQIKKKNIEKVISSIINKKNPSNMKNESGMWKSRGAPVLKQSMLSSNRSHSRLIESLSKEQLFVDIDQQIGEMVMINQENFAPFAERVKSILGKAKYQTVNRQRLEREREVQEFIRGIGGNPKKRLNPQAFKKVTGMIDSLHEIKIKEDSIKKVQRAQSAKTLRNKADDSTKTLRAGSRLLSGFNRSCSNLKKESFVEDHLVRAKDIIKKVNECLDDQSQKKKTSLSSMKSMGEQWSRKGQLHKTMATYGEQKWNNSTLQILRQRRLKSYALQRIDNQLFQN